MIPLGIEKKSFQRAVTVQSVKTTAQEGFTAKHQSRSGLETTTFKHSENSKISNKVLLNLRLAHETDMKLRYTT